jgi:hypothetical protein
LPRQSAEARAAAYLRQGGKYPSPPANLSDDAKKLWKEIVEDRPIDYFRPGALYLLEQLCIMTVAAHRVSAWLQERPGDEEAAALYLKYAHQCAMHCTKLRLSIQTEVDRKSGQLDEKEPSVKGRKEKADVLFGGSNVVKF